jgi:hypothetical protein
MILVLIQSVRLLFFDCFRDDATVSKREEIENVYLIARVLYKAILGLHYKRQEQKKTGQLAIF